VKLLAAAALVLGLAGATAWGPVLAGCPVFPASSVWNKSVDTLPVAADSARVIDAIGAREPVHADFGDVLCNGSRGAAEPAGGRTTSYTRSGV
jgi:hypothetical protein